MFFNGYLHNYRIYYLGDDSLPTTEKYLYKLNKQNIIKFYPKVQCTEFMLYKFFSSNFFFCILLICIFSVLI